MLKVEEVSFLLRKLVKLSMGEFPSGHCQRGKSLPFNHFWKRERRGKMEYVIAVVIGLWVFASLFFLVKKLYEL